MPDTPLPADIPAPVLDRLFHTARTPHAWTDAPVTEETIHRLYELVRLAPTAFNASPARFVFLTTPEAKERLRPALKTNNVPKLNAGAVVIVAHDTRFYEHLPTLSPHYDPSGLFVDNPALAEITAFRSGTLQAGYLILAARLLGLDAGPMSGFDNAAVDAAFFPDGRVRSNLLVALGRADGPHPRPRAPRLDVAQAVTIL